MNQERRTDWTESGEPEHDATEGDGTNGGGGDYVDGGEMLEKVVERSLSGDESALPALRKLMDEVPEVASELANFACNVERVIVRKMAGGNPMVEEAIPRELEAMRKDLAGENPSTLEGLLVRRIGVCRLQLQHFEVLYARSMDRLNDSQDEFHQKRIDRAHRRYLSSIRTLAQIRKMGPSVQINIADKQFNTAS